MLYELIYIITSNAVIEW